MAKNKIYYLRIDGNLLRQQRRSLNHTKMNADKEGIVNLLQAIDDINCGYHALVHNQGYWWLRITVKRQGEGPEFRDFLIEASSLIKAQIIAASTVFECCEGPWPPVTGELGWYYFNNGQGKARIEWLQPTSPEEYLERYLKTCLLKEREDDNGNE